MKNKTTQFEINSKQSRAGAKACLKVMQDIQRIIGNGANSRVVYDKKCADSERAMLKSAEPGLSSFMEGFVIAFAEYQNIFVRSMAAQSTLTFGFLMQP